MMRLESDVGGAEKIGLLGSPSSTSELRLDIVAKAAEKGLVGQIVFLKYRQDDCDTYAIGQINKVTLKKPVCGGSDDEKPYQAERRGPVHHRKPRHPHGSDDDKRRIQGKMPAISRRESLAPFRRQTQQYASSTKAY